MHVKKANSEEAKLYCNYQQEDGWTALMLASQNGHAQVAELLLNGNADTHLTENDGWTALMLASQNGHVQVVGLLLTNKQADANILNNNRFTALMLASQNGHFQVVELLLTEYADVNLKENDGWTALMLASQNGHFHVTELLLNREAAVNISSENGITALMLASQNGYFQIAELLLSNQADPNVTENDGWTALMLASQNGHCHIVELLLNKQTDANLTENDGWTALMLASQNGHLQVVDLLINKEADASISNRKGFTASELAFQNGHFQIVELLKRKVSLRYIRLIQIKTSLLNILKRRLQPFQLQKIVHHVSKLPINKDTSANLVPPQLLRNAKTIDEVLDLIKPFIKFNRYEILSHLFEKFGNKNEDEEIVKNYKELVDKFNREIKVGELIELMNQHHDEDESHIEKAKNEGVIIKMVLDDTYKHKTLNQLQENILAIFECENYVLMLAEIQLGSIQIMWYTGVEAIPYLTEKAKRNKQKFKQMGVISLMVGHETVQKGVSLHYIIMLNIIFIIDIFPVTWWYCSSSAENAILFINITGTYTKGYSV